MGKKKSVVLLTLLTIVIVALCAMIVVPSFELPFLWNGAVSNWNPVVKTYDLDANLGGGYYTYYYPEGVISEVEYQKEYESRSEDKQEEYENSYTPYKGLYLSTDSDDGVVEETENGYVVTDSFKESFEAAKKEISSRYEKRGDSSFRVSVVDDYALRIELPVSDTAAGTAFSYFFYTGEFTLYDGTNTVLEASKDESPKDYIKGFSPKKNGDSTYIQVKLTDEGRKLIKDVTTSLASSSSSDDGSTSSGGTLSFKVGDESIIQLSVTEAIDEKTLYIGGTDTYTDETASVVAILLNSALNAGDLGLGFEVEETRTFGPAYGSNALTLLYIALAIVLVASIIWPFIKYKGFGGACAYSTLSYLIVTAICFAFISSGVFEVTLGTVAIFLFGLLLTNLFNARVYGAIKSEFDTGKTVDSSVKAGYKKTLAGMIDVYAVLVLASVALLIGAAGLHTLALQALICFVTGAFCNLLWTRFINCMLVSSSKDKYKYFGFVREDDDDE